jgi:glycosyltransferase involved in cell wall biosynthesis
MGRSDALLFPTRSTEALGLVPLEAMAVGTPVVMTVTGGPADYARHEENCLVVEPGDVAAVVNAVQRLEGDNRLRARLIAGGHATAEAYQGDRCNAAALSIVAEAAA